MQMSGFSPYGGGRLTSSDARQVDGRDSKAGPSSALRPSSRQTPKRRKLNHQENTVSHYFPNKQRRPAAQAIPSTSTSISTSLPSSSHPSRPTSSTIIIDAEDDTLPATDDGPHEPVVVKTSSPDPMDVIGSDTSVSYAFDQNKPSPMDLYSSSLEGTRKPLQDGESTQRVRSTMAKVGVLTNESLPHLDGDDDNPQPAKTRPARHSRVESTSQAEASSSGSRNVKEKVAQYEQRNVKSPPHVNLLEKLAKPTRKNGMKPKQPTRNIPPLPMQLQDIDATRPSGFISGRVSKGKAGGSSISLHLPLKDWAIGATVASQGAASDLHANLIWESGVLKVRDGKGSTRFELQVKKGSVDIVNYVDIKRTTTPEPLIQIHPFVVALVQYPPTAFNFKPGSSDLDGLLTFKFDTSASDWDDGVYAGIVQKLVDLLTSKSGKSILDGPAARAVWEAVTRVHEGTSIISDLEPMIVDIPKENPPNSPSKPRSRPKPDATPTTGVRRSARLSGGAEDKRSSLRPDPDEVILGYRSGTGSLNITNGDVSRLKPGEFLNDTLIEFGLKLWLADLQDSNPELASQVHVFSSFFYKKLSTKIPEEGYNSVRKWTSRFDLFQKKYIIVPINENLHWYLAIIYCPEYTLLPPPTLETNDHLRRSTRRLGVVIDPLDAQQPELASRQSLPPDPDPPPNGHIDSRSTSELVEPETPRTDDQKSEMDVERMVESALTPVEPTPKRVDDEQQQDGAVNPDTPVIPCPDSPMLAYPQSSSPYQSATLLPLDPQGDDTEQSDLVASAGEREGDIPTRASSIPPAMFYGTKPQVPGDVTPPRIVPVDASVLPEIEIEEDETVGNPESEAEGVVERPRTYIFTFDSLASKHPQAVKRLSRYLLMEAHDKKQLAEDSLTEPKGMQAIVPAQPNYCDCGIYLLHFAKTFMKDPKLSSDIIRSRMSPQKGRRVPHEHWDGASVFNYRDSLADRIHALSKEWKKQRGEQDSGTKNQTDGAGPPPQEQLPRGDPTPTVSSKAENDDSDSDIEVLGSPQKAPASKASRRDSGLGESRKGPAARVRG